MTSLGNRMVYNQKDLTIERVNSGAEEVKSFKENLVALIDKFAETRDKSEEADVKRLASITISKLEEACMFGVKTLTYNK